MEKFKRTVTNKTYLVNETNAEAVAALSIYNNFIAQDPNLFKYGTEYMKTTLFYDDAKIQYISNLAQQITQNAATSADKIFAVCKYIAENIYYDRDYLYGSSATFYRDPYNVLIQGYTICCGYAETCNALLQCLNIPCADVVSAMDSGICHEFSCAYDGNRWILFDSTACSQNNYGGGHKCPAPAIFQIFYDFDNVDQNWGLHCIADMEYTQIEGNLIRFPYRSLVKSYTIPDSVTSIDSGVARGISLNWAFFGCENLEHINIPSSVTNIGELAFGNCNSLWDMHFYGNAPTLDPNCFTGCPSSLKVYYTSGAAGFTNPWNNFEAILFTPTPTVKPTPKPTPKIVHVKTVKLNKTALTLNKGKTYKLIASISPSNANNKKVTWKSSNKAIATVSSTGVVKGIKKGTTYIYVYTVDGKKTAKCKVTIK